MKIVFYTAIMMDGEYPPHITTIITLAIIIEWLQSFAVVSDKCHVNKIAEISVIRVG